MGPLPLRRRTAGALATVALVTAVPLAMAAVRTDTIVSGITAEVDYHSEGQIDGGNIHIISDRAPAQGQASTSCDPDPRAEPHLRPSCSFAPPAGQGDEFISFGRHVPDGDSSPNGAFTPVDSPETRDYFNATKAGIRDGGWIFEGDFFDDIDVRFRLAPVRLDALLAPEGDANNRWRRICGVGEVLGLSRQNQGGALDHPMAAPFARGQLRKFVVQIWDADWRDSSDNDGGNQDFFAIDILKPGSTFDTTECNEPSDETPRPPGPLDPGPNGEDPRPTQGAAANRPTPSVPARVVGSAVAGARASLEGRSGCVKRAFRAQVKGTSIASVAFFLDGKHVATDRRPDRRGAFSRLIRPTNMIVGRHRVTAVVTFASNSGAGRRTMAFNFRRCAPAVKAARFTG